MKIHVAVGIVAVLASAACGAKTDTAAQPSSVTSAASVGSEPPQTSAVPALPAKGDKPPRTFVVGKWGTDGDCALAIDLRADGTSDGPFGNWTYSDGVISFPDEPEFKVSVTVIDDNTMESTNDSSDKTSKMTRCP